MLEIKGRYIPLEKISYITSNNEMYLKEPVTESGKMYLDLDEHELQCVLTYFNVKKILSEAEE